MIMNNTQTKKMKNHIILALCAGVVLGALFTLSALYYKKHYMFPKGTIELPNGMYLYPTKPHFKGYRLLNENLQEIQGIDKDILYADWRGEYVFGFAIDDSGCKSKSIYFLYNKRTDLKSIYRQRYQLEERMKAEGLKIWEDSETKFIRYEMYKKFPKEDKPFSKNFIGINDALKKLH